MSHEFHKLTIADVVRETDKSSSFYFEVPDHLQEAFRFKPGQYLTFRTQIKGNEYRRSYSICTSPHEDRLGVNVKRVKKGIVSNYINDELTVGKEVELMGPEGNFTIDIGPSKKRDFYFFAAGSGITPVISLIKTILEDEPKSCCYLCYGNKDEDSIIFKDELTSLVSRYDGQLFLTYTLSQPKRAKEKGLKGMFSKGKIMWEGWTGRIDSNKIDRFCEENPSRTDDKHYFVCGPGAMIDTIIDHIQSKGIEKDRLHTEHFLSSSGQPAELSGDLVTSDVKVHLDGRVVEVQVSPDKTILDVLIEEKFDPPYSCTSGACSTCVAKLIQGQVKMDACYALDDAEVKAGYILVCQSRAATETVELKFES